MKTARFSFGPDYVCQYEWAEDCFVQCGGDAKNGWFFESFPRNPNTFLRGDSKESVEDAERKCWEEFQQQNKCNLDHSDINSFTKVRWDGHEYDNGVGWCKSCGMFKSECFPPWEECYQCKEKTFYSRDNKGNRWCKKCYNDIPEDWLTDSIKWSRKMKKIQEQEITKEEFTEALDQVITHICEKTDE